MPCSAYTNSAPLLFLTGTVAARTGGLHFRNVRHLTVEASRRLLQINSFTLRSQPGPTHRISTLQAPEHLNALSSNRIPRSRKKRPHPDRHGSITGSNFPRTLRENSGEVAQIAATPVASCSKRHSMRYRGYRKSPPSPKKGASIDKCLEKADMKSLRLRGNATSRYATELIRTENSGSFNLAGHVRRAQLRDCSSRTIKGSKETIPSTRSRKASTGSKSGTQIYKDQREPWQAQKKALSEKFGPSGWLPRKRLSPDALEGIRALHAQYPDKFTTPILADQFKVSPEAIRRILKSKWRPKDDEEERRRRRWENRGENIWSQMVEMGIKPPKKWRDMGVGKSRGGRPARSKQLDSRIMSKPITSSPRIQPTTDLAKITANGKKTASPVLLADRIL